jgi:hypothetical protein
MNFTFSLNHGATFEAVPNFGGVLIKSVSKHQREEQAVQPETRSFLQQGQFSAAVFM